MRLKKTFGRSEHRVALLQLLRTIDYQFFLEYVHQNSQQQSDHEKHSSEIRQLFRWGLNEAMHLIWNEHVDLPGVPLVCTFPTLRDWAAAMLQCAGRIRLVEYGMELERVKLATVSRHPDTANAFIFEYAEGTIGVESVEKDDAEIFGVLIARLHQRDGVWKDLSDRRKEIARVMSDLVKPWEKHYIGYGADPKVDSYYNDLASAIAPTMHGWDAFPQETRFGGISFLTYINCVRVLVGFALKHIDFCILLCRMDSKIDPINILSVPSEWDKTCRYMSDALGVPISEAEQAMQVTVVSSENVKQHISIPAGPFAPHYKIASGSVIRLITGCLESPFLFMLRELKRKYPRDWDKSVDSREAVFRAQLSALLTRNEHVAAFSDNINIRCTRGQTDIDALAIDPVAGVVGIFQLKWQDYFGASIRERESRKTNLLKNGNAWVEKVLGWLDEGRLAQALVSLGVPRKVAHSIRQAHLFVIGRNFSHFSGDFKPDSRAAWGSWAQVLKLMDGPGEGNSAITILHDLLVADSPTDRAQAPRKTEEFEVDDWKWIMRPNKDWSNADSL
jgi:hypothetical protein